jgi:tetratricopeptide (TPR) repeat protein
LDDVSSAFNKGTDEVTLAAALRSAEKKADEGDLRGAIDEYNKALKIYTDRGDWESATEIRVYIADLYEELGEYKSALNELKDAQEVYVRAGDSLAVDGVSA